MPFARPIVCVVTRARGTSGSADRAALLDRLEAAAAAGASMIQVRERQMDDRQLVTFLEDLQARVAAHGSLVLVNDRIDVAVAAAAAGVHLKGDAPAVAEVRRLLPPGAIIGRSVHSEDEARDVSRAGGCDYLVFGTVFASTSKPEHHPVAGTEALARVCAATALPVIAIGGITVDRAPAVAAAGAAGAAAISLFSGARQIGETVMALRDALTPQRGNV